MNIEGQWGIQHSKGSILKIYTLLYTVFSSVDKMWAGWAACGYIKWRSFRGEKSGAGEIGSWNRSDIHPILLHSHVGLSISSSGTGRRVARSPWLLDQLPCHLFYIAWRGSFQIVVCRAVLSSAHWPPNLRRWENPSYHKTMVVLIDTSVRWYLHFYRNWPSVVDTRQVQHWSCVSFCQTFSVCLAFNRFF